MKTVLFSAALLTATTIAFGQVGIGTITPDSSSALDVVSTNKGILLPNVNLTSVTEDIDGEPGQATGLLVYNSGSTLAAGYYFWNGTEWRTIDNSAAAAPAITALSCTVATLNPQSYTSGVAYSGTMTIPYTGGNGGAYASGASTTVNGLTFKLRSGSLENGDGVLSFNVSGTPTVSSPVATNVAISSTTVPFLPGALNCTASVGNKSDASLKYAATLGPLTITTDPAAGYQSVITTPDGKFSVRAVVMSGQTVGLTDIQIKSNSGTPTIIWNFMTDYVNGHIVYGNNGTTFPAANTWYGNGGGTGTVMGTAMDNAWGDADVYFGSPEYRRYTWATTNSADKTMYILTFMMSAVPNDGLVVNATNCPAGICTATKVFFKIEQVTGS